MSHRPSPIPHTDDRPPRSSEHGSSRSQSTPPPVTPGQALPDFPGINNSPGEEATLMPNGHSHKPSYPHFSSSPRVRVPSFSREARKLH